MARQRLSKRFRLDEHISKAEQAHHLEPRQGGPKLGRMELSEVKPLLHCASVGCSVILQQLGEMFYRDIQVFAANDFHNSSFSGCRCIALSGTGKCPRPRKKRRYVHQHTTIGHLFLASLG
jgi:hypothetical protein